MPFSTSELHPDLLRGIKDLGFTRPTPIQEQAIPPAMLHRDILACATTGSGKTAAFVLPILHHLMKKPRRVTRALILTPTRELAAQIHAHLEELAVHTPVTGASVFGGVGMGPQEHAFRSGTDVIVATPGRLLDHLGRPYARLDGLEILVLDEADRMLDMGFLPDVRRILRQIPAKRQTLFFSATLPPKIIELSREMLHNPVIVNLARISAPAVGITQAVYPVPRERKAALLVDLLQRDVIADAIVFTRTKHRANRLADFLEKQGVSTGRIHGNRSQSQRTAALAGFKAGSHRILVATDIVARGIDVEELGHVINFDVPADPDSYVHRVGRTARAEATGDAFTFVSPDEESDLRQIGRILGKSLPRVTVPGFDYSVKSGERLEIPVRDRVAAHRAQKGARGSGGARHSGGGSGPSRSKSPGGRSHGGSGSGGSGRPSKGFDRAGRMQAILEKYSLPQGTGSASPSARRRGR